jgi:LPXTG-motif cell wall-anchored protein
MDLGPLIAASHGGGHGPQMHGPFVVILMALALVGGLAFLVRKRRRRKDGDRDPEGARDPGTRAPSDRGSG